MTGSTSGVDAANTAAARALVGALAAAGVRDACITPGSRSTPLTVAFAQQTVIRPWLHLDERSSSYFALGLARASGRPVAIVCTSGTAAANFYPAVVEANLSRIPLIVCTTDRPPRLRDLGADQTMDQAGMFGSNVRWQCDLRLPAGLPDEARQFEAYGRRAVATALSPLPGPVHLNCPFEEPLLSGPDDLPPFNLRLADATPIEQPQTAPPPHAIADAVARIRGARRPIIVAGPDSAGLPAAEIAALAAAIDAPIFADPLSGLRTGPHDRFRILDSYDAVLRDSPTLEFTADCVIRFGATPVSKSLNQYLAKLGGADQILVEQFGGWRDPGALSTVVLFGSTTLIADALREAVPAPTSAPDWCPRWIARDRAAGYAMRTAAMSFAEPFEGRVFVELQELLPAGATIVAGNSMPVRDLDSFLATSDKPLRLVGNRGAAGIDGVTSTALGEAAAGRGPVVLVIGDISFYHDLNGLWAAKRHHLDLTIVVVNNNGGGIFHYLPQAAHGELFEEWFGTPPDLDFSHAVAMYGGRFTATRDWTEFRAAMSAFDAPGLKVIELTTDRAQNTRMHREAWAAAALAARSEALV